MESYSETFVGTSKVTFYGVVSTYPSVSFYFSFPAQYKPEAGDWIALYPVGWSNLVGDFVVKKMVKPESLWNGIYSGDKWIGNMEFEMADWVQSVPSYSPVPMATKFAKDQYYQLVYVKNGDLVLGASKPFSLYISDMFSGYSSYKPTYVIDGAEATGCLVSSFPLTSEFSIEPQTEKQLQQLISNVYSIEQSIGGWYKTPQASYNGVETYFKNSFGELYSKFGPTESLVNQVVLPHQIHKYWMTRLGEMEHMMMEQFKIEQAQRRIDQTYILAQLKTYERYVFYMMKNEQAINEYMRGAKLAAKLAEFEKKCYEIVKTHLLVEQPVEYYVQKYEQLLKEKIELEIAERAKYLPKLRQLVKECLEFKLKEIQSMEHQYYTRFYKLIKTKLGMWESKYYQPIVGQFIGTKLDQAFLYEEKMDYELRQQLKYLIGQFYTEQAKELYQLVKLNKQISWLCGEISSKLYQYEWTYGSEMYAQIKLAPKLKPIMYISSVLYPFYTSLVGLPINTESEETYFEYEPIKKLVQLEQTLFQLRGTLKYSLFSGYQDKYPVGYEMWSPIEYYLQSGCHSVWKHLQMLERKLVFLKGIWLEKQLKSYLMQRLTDYEVVPTITTKFGDKIKYIKSVFSKHYQLPTYEAYWPAQGHYLFTTPESFVQHHEQFDKLWTLFNEFEFGTIWGEQTGLSSYYGPSFSKDLDYPFFNPIGKQYFGSNYSAYRYPTSYLTSKYEAYPYGEFYGNESFKPYKPYLSRSSVFSTSYVPLSASKAFGGVSNPIDTVIGELESELTKMKVQKEMPYEFPTTFPSSVYPVASFIPSSASSFF